MKINNYLIGRESKPFIIAELSGNHNQAFDRAMHLIDLAALAEVDCIKLQTYTADTITLPIKDREFLISDIESPWYGKSLHDLYTEAHTPWEWHPAMLERAKINGISALSSVFDETSVAFLETLDVPAYKIVSQEIVHHPLLAEVARTGKPVIVSTGMASLGEIEEALNVLVKNGCKEYALLKCTSSYPASPIDSNISAIPVLKKVFGCEIGLSDHTLGIGVPIAAVALGATIIEKHFTLSRSEGGVDSLFSLEPDELSALVRESKSAWESIGVVEFGITEAQKISESGRRSIYASKFIKAGTEITADALKIIRPNKGLPPKYIELVIGKKVLRDINYGDPITWENIL